MFGLLFECQKGKNCTQMENHFNNISISRIREYLPEDKYLGVDNEFFIIDTKSMKQPHTFAYPCRFDGYLAIFCVKGGVRITMNMNEFEMRDNTLLLSLPGNIIKVSELSEGMEPEDMRYVILAMSKEYLSGMRMDMNRIFSDAMPILENPCLRLEEKETALAGKYLELLANVMAADIQYKTEVMHSLLSSVFYLIAGVWTSRMTEKRKNVPVQSSRSKMIFEQFIRLVAEHHTKERNVGFYADKLCLTPKYLSKLIKTASGRSAPEWIDSYVILEAKNLLKYSNMTIKEIVYRLNFPNQSVFYKFFKARTGQTPSEYRNS